MVQQAYPRLANQHARRPARRLVACTIIDDECYAQIAGAAAQADRGDALARGIAYTEFGDDTLKVASDYVLDCLKGVMAEHEAAAEKLPGVSPVRLAREPVAEPVPPTEEEQGEWDRQHTADPYE